MDNETALHYALNSEVAQLIVHSVESRSLKFLLWKPAFTGYKIKWTALDTAVDEDRFEVAHYLCSLTSGNKDLLKDGYFLPGYAPLQKAKSVRMTRMLVSFVLPENRANFLLESGGSWHKWTALHEATSSGNDELVEYLCSCGVPELLLCQDAMGDTALHYAYTNRAVQAIVRSLFESNNGNFMYKANNYGEIPFHKMITREGLESAVLEYYLANVTSANELVFMKGTGGKTTLHNAHKEEIVRTLLSAAEDKDAYARVTDDGGRTALHQASTKQIASILLNTVEDKETYLTIRDEESKTPLHYASTGEIAELLLSESEDKFNYINIADNKGLTCLMFMALRGDSETLKHTLQYLEETWSDADLQETLLQTNNKRQNIFHLAGISLEVHRVAEELKDYLVNVEIEDILVPDKYNNTPLTYLCARYSTHTFSDCLMRVPPWNRRKILLTGNERGATCQFLLEKEKFDSSDYMKIVLCTEDAAYADHLYSLTSAYVTGLRYTSDKGALFRPEDIYKRDMNIIRVMKYALNEYSPQDLSCSQKVVSIHLYKRIYCIML